MNHSGDDDLRDLFAHSRTEDRKRAGDFATFLAARASRASRRPALTRRVTLLAAASIVAAVAYVGLRERPGLPGSVQEPRVLTLDPRSTSWESPTDFLLATPGGALLRTLPTLHYTAPDILPDSSLTPQPAGASPASRARRINS